MGLDTSEITEWRSIVVLIVFVLTNLVVLFPFRIPVWIPKSVHQAYFDTLSSLRITSPRSYGPQQNVRPSDAMASGRGSEGDQETARFVKVHFPLSFVTAPLIADLFLLAISAIGRKEVHDGTVGADHIYPTDIMVFFLSLAYIAISIDVSGLIRWLAFKVLQKAGKHGHRLYFYLYVFFFSLASFIGNDPIILSGTAFLAYMTRAAENIKNPKAWIHTQFALANIGSAVLVSSNPTNLVLAGAFQITFITYTANVIVPVIATVILLFPFLLYGVFHDKALIPSSVKLHELPPELKEKRPTNPNIPYSRGLAGGGDEKSEEKTLASLEEVLNPFLDGWDAGISAGVMAVTLITILVINAALPNGTDIPVFYMTLPAGAVVFAWGIFSGWRNRTETREIAAAGKRAVESYRAGRSTKFLSRERISSPITVGTDTAPRAMDGNAGSRSSPQSEVNKFEEATDWSRRDSPLAIRSSEAVTKKEVSPSNPSVSRFGDQEKSKTLVSLLRDGWHWSRGTFPTVTAVLGNLPYALVPFSFCMFILVQALVTRGWITVFAYGWSHWVEKTGTVGAIGGMAFLSVILCNFAGTNIGATILLSRLMQAWVKIHEVNQDPISQRTFWATVYSMAIGVNYGAFSTFFSASLAGLLWRDILRRKNITVREAQFAKVNLPIIAFTTAVGCAVLIGEVFISRSEAPYQASD